MLPVIRGLRWVHVQDQECYGGCFSPSNSLRGEIAALRIWKRARSLDDIKKDMYSLKPSNTDGLVSMYNMEVRGLPAMPLRVWYMAARVALAATRFVYTIFPVS